MFFLYFISQEWNLERSKRVISKRDKSFKLNEGKLEKPHFKTNLPGKVIPFVE